MRGRYGRAELAVLAVLALVTVWNAARYPPGQGYDAEHHISYAVGLVERGELPDQAGEYYTPPLFYALAGVAREAGQWIGLGEPLRLVQLLNAALAIGTALLVLEFARELWPGRRRLHLAALVFAALSPPLVKTTAMVHPEVLSCFLAALALLLAARLLRRGRWTLTSGLGLGVALGAGQLTRAWALWTFGVVAVVLAATWIARRSERPAILRTALAALAATAVIAGPWYVWQASRYSNPVFDQPQAAVPLWDRRPASFYLDPGVPDIVSRPYRPHDLNLFWPTLYSDSWGDYFGFWAWNSAKEDVDAGTRWALVAQSVAGIAPTLLAVAGWLMLLASAVRLRLVREAPERLLAALMPVAGLAGLLYFTTAYPTADGDVIKATYMLTTLPAWAVCFGLALDRLLLRAGSLAVPLFAVLAACGLVILRFDLYRFVLWS